MTRLATSGTSSCAMISLQGFSDQDLNKEKEYLNGGQYEIEMYNKTMWGKEVSNYTVQEFFDSILYPVRQDLGRTKDYPFSLLMELINKHDEMGHKLILATLNSYQRGQTEWPKKLEKEGFKILDVTDNNLGGRCYIYVRNEPRPAGLRTYCCLKAWEKKQ